MSDTIRNDVPFPGLLASVTARDTNGTWAIVDNLVKEIDAESEDTLTSQLEKASEMLKDYGFDYAPGTLGQLRNLGIAFPPNRRHDKIGWTIHDEIGNADLMDKYIAATRTKVIKLSKRDARDYIDRLEDLNRQEWEAKWNAENEQKIEDLSDEIDAAEEAKEKATNDIELANAEKRIREATRARKDQENKKTPTYIPREDLTHVPADIPALRGMININSVLADIGGANSLLQKAVKTLQECADTFDELYSNNVSNEILRVQNTAAEALSLVRSRVTNKKRGIKVIK